MLRSLLEYNLSIATLLGLLSGFAVVRALVGWVRRGRRRRTLLAALAQVNQIHISDPSRKALDAAWN